MIPFKSKLQHIENIKERNAIFAELSDSEKLKEVAYDTLLNYQMGLILHQETLEYWPNNGYTNCSKTRNAEDLQQAVITSKKEILCSCCARGAMMVSRISIGNTVGPESAFWKGIALDEEGYEQSLIEGMSVAEMVKIEDLYEYHGFLRYGRKSPECIAAICANMIVHGHFNKADKTDYLAEWKII